MDLSDIELGEREDGGTLKPLDLSIFSDIGVYVPGGEGAWAQHTPTTGSLVSLARGIEYLSQQIYELSKKG